MEKKSAREIRLETEKKILQLEDKIIRLKIKAEKARITEIEKQLKKCKSL